jgi:hypothetical protein
VRILVDFANMTQLDIREAQSFQSSMPSTTRNTSTLSCPAMSRAPATWQRDMHAPLASLASCS